MPAVLNKFLVEERAATEFGRAKKVAWQICDRLQEIVNRRVPLLRENIAVLEAKIASITKWNFISKALFVANI